MPEEKDRRILELLTPLMERARENQQALGARRVEFRKRFNSEPYGNEKPGWCRTVHPTIANAVNWLKPGLYEIFANFDFWTLKPHRRRLPEGDKGKGLMDQETARHVKSYITAKLEEQDWETLVDHAIHEALVSQFFVAKVTYAEDFDLTDEVWDSATGEELRALLDDPDVTVVRYASKTGPDGLPDPDGGAEKVRLKRRRYRYKGPKVELIPPWEFYFAPGYATLEQTPFTAHVVRRTLDEVRRKERDGIYRKGSFEKLLTRVTNHGNLSEAGNEMREIDPNDAHFLDRSIHRTGKEAVGANEVLIWECYTRLDIDNDGFLEEVIVTVCEDVVLMGPVENPYGSAPFVLGTVESEPFKLTGRPVAERLDGNQRVMTNLLRLIMDSAARSAYVTHLTTDPSVKRALINAGPGDVALVQNLNTIREVAPSPPNELIFKAFALFRQENDKTVGVNELTQGMAEGALSRTVGATAMLMSAGQAVQKLMARRLARAFKRILQRVIDVLRIYPAADDGFDARIDLEMDKSDVFGRYSIVIDVGVGPQDRVAAANVLDQHLKLLTQFLVPGGGAGMEHVVRTAMRKNRLLDQDITDLMYTPEELAATAGSRNEAETMKQEMKKMAGRMRDMEAYVRQLQKGGSDARKPGGLDTAGGTGQTGPNDPRIRSLRFGG